jgi:predicted component of type VI protein secretion system
MPFPLIGEVQAAGLRPTELEARMRQLLAKEISGARTIVARESKEAIRLDARALPAVAQLLTGPAVEADLLWHALPRDPGTLVDLSRVLDLGDLYSKMGMPDQAKAQYQTVLARQPAHEAAARGLASLRNPG